jgi:hypothetical protein
LPWGPDCRVTLAAAAGATTVTLVAANGTTGPAALRLTIAAAGEKLLVVRAEDKLLAAVGAGQGLVGEGHSNSLLV